MKNIANFFAQLHLVFETPLSEEVLLENFDPQVIYDSKISFTLPDGSVHKASFAHLVELECTEFVDNSEEDEDK